MIPVEIMFSLVAHYEIEIFFLLGSEWCTFFVYIMTGHNSSEPIDCVIKKKLINDCGSI